jgi:hypothetical protein
LADDDTIIPGSSVQIVAIRVEGRIAEAFVESQPAIA